MQILLLLILSSRVIHRGQNAVNVLVSPEI